MFFENCLFSKNKLCPRRTSVTNVGSVLFWLACNDGCFGFSGTLRFSGLPVSPASPTDRTTDRTSDSHTCFRLMQPESDPLRAVLDTQLSDTSCLCVSITPDIPNCPEYDGLPGTPRCSGKCAFNLCCWTHKFALARSGAYCLIAGTAVSRFGHWQWAR